MKKAPRSPEYLSSPNAGCNVFPQQGCVKFAARTSLSVPQKECWYCRHADFRLENEKALEIGICCYPLIIID